MRKSSTVLIGILVLLGIATFFVLREPGERSLQTSAGEPLVKYDSAAVDKMDVRGPNGAVTLEKIGGKWTLTSPVKYAADETAVTSAVGKGREMKITNLASTNPAKQTLYAIDSTATLVSMYANNNRVASFRVGKPGSNWSETYVRKEGSNDVYTVDGMLGPIFNKKNDDWRDKTILKTDQNGISEVKFRFRDTTFALAKKDSMHWMIGSDSTINSTVTSFLNSLSSFQTDEFVDSEITAPPDLTATIETNGTQLQFYKRSDNKYYVRASNSPQWFTVQEWRAGQVLKRKRDFVPAPPAKK